MSKPYTVLVIVEAKPGKETELKHELIKVIAPSRAENACIEYRLHQDLSNPTKFVFYENWASKAEHQQQFQKSYIATLAEKIEHLLAEPYQVIFAEELESHHS